MKNENIKGFGRSKRKLSVEMADWCVCGKGRSYQWGKKNGEIFSNGITEHGREYDYVSKSRKET